MRLLFFAVILSFGSLISCNNDGKKPGTDSSETTEPGKPVTTIDSLLQALNKRIADNPNDYSAYLARARYFGDHEKFNDAFQDIGRALAIDSTKSDIYLYKGELFFKQTKVKESYEEYKACLFYDSVNADCLINKSEIDIILGNYDIARQQLNTVVKNNEYNAKAYYMRGRLYKTQGDTTLAASSYKTAIEVDPNYYDAYIEVALLCAAQKSDLAKEYYNSAISIRPKSVEAWYDKAMFLQETGYKKKEKYKEAFACYDTILKIDPGFFAAHFNKGYIWLEYLHQYDSASVHFTKAVTQFPQYYQAYFNRGLCYESMNRKKDAEADYRTALSINPKYDDAAKALDRVLRN